MIRVPPEDIESVWPKAKEMLRPSFRYIRNSHTVDDYLEPLKAGTMQLWLAGDKGAVVTHIDDEAEGRVLFIQSLAGEDFTSWVKDMNAALDEFALEYGCVAIEAVSNRKGFVRLMPGFMEDGVIYVKMLGAKNG